MGRAWEVARGVWSAGVEIPAARRGYDGSGGAGVMVLGRGCGGGDGSGRLECWRRDTRGKARV